jgi:hypothetical protein
MSGMGRREFVALLGGAVAWPLAVGAQQGERMRRLGVLMPFTAVRAEAVRKDLQSAVRTMGVQLQIFTASSGLEIDTAFAAVARERADALFVGGSLFHPNRVRRARICRCGRLISYGTSVADMYRQVGI